VCCTHTRRMAVQPTRAGRPTGRWEYREEDTRPTHSIRKNVPAGPFVPQNGVCTTLACGRLARASSRSVLPSSSVGVFSGMACAVPVQHLSRGPTEVQRPHATRRLFAIGTVAHDKTPKVRGDVTSLGFGAHSSQSLTVPR